jgi:LDH2 family malate/lactate/ureidoglycolate dehydrogenase
MAAMADTGFRARIDALRPFAEAAYAYAGVQAGDARVVVDVQLEADMRGVTTHGLQRLPWYIGRLRAGENRVRPEIRVVKESSVSVALDGDNGIGQLVCVRLMEATLAKARESGLAVGTVRNSNDWGAGAYYPMMAAREGFVALCTTTSVPTLAPFGARTRVFGNNPIAFAAPRREGPPVVLDMALTPVALGKVLRARAEQTPIPLDWGFRDNEGQPTTDADAAIRGVIPAIGGYKGIGLSVMTNVLAGILSGSAHSGSVDVGRRGQFFLVLSPGLFGDETVFLGEVEEMARQVAAAELLPGVAEAMLPGEPEHRNLAAARASGAVSYPPTLVRDLEALAGEIGYALPQGWAVPAGA